VAGTPVLASAVLVLDDVVAVDAVARPFVDVVDEVERAAVVFVPLPDVVAVARPLVELDVLRAVVVTEADVVGRAEVVGRVAVVGRTVPVGRGRVDVAVAVGPVVGPVVPVAVAVLVGGTVTKLLMMVDSHVTVEPPAAEPLHWLIVIGSEALTVDGFTVHLTRREAPPPLAEPLHWVMSALVVLPFGLQAVVGSVPPPVPDSMHWLTVAGDFDPFPVMVLVIRTEQIRLAPPPRADPLHWVTVVESATTGVVVHSGAAPAAPWHSSIVPLELLTPVARLMTLLMMTWHSTFLPPVLYTSLHWLTCAPAADAEGASPPSRPITKISTATAEPIRPSRRNARAEPTAETIAPCVFSLRAS
jgi:hypothetical protein